MSAAEHGAPISERTVRQWTQKDITDCAVRWRAGESATQIGRALQRTRNSIVAKMHRLRVPTPASPYPDGLPKYDYEDSAKRHQRKRAAKERRERAMAGKLKQYYPENTVRPARQKRLFVLPDNLGFTRAPPWHPARDAKPQWLQRACAST